eukprot:4330181-Ditylum_brightwellii.AAC.1
MLPDLTPPDMNGTNTATPSAFVRESSQAMEAVSADSSNSDVRPDLDQQRKQSTIYYHHH